MKVSMRNSLVVLALLGLPLSAAQANLIVNPSFELPAISAGSFSVFGAIPGWATSSGSGIEIQNNVAGSPFDGAQHVELDSFSNSGMIQSVATIAGAIYDLSFAYSPRPNVPSTSNGIDVFFDGGLVTSLTASGSGSTNWSVFGFSVTAAGALSTVEFVATGTSDSLGGYLDAVGLVERVPEPITLLLLGFGLAGLGFSRQRRAW